jgi:hypothetical protein
MASTSELQPCYMCKGKLDKATVEIAELMGYRREKSTNGIENLISL